MKKSLLALAAMGAFTGAAHAQSSVTVYGILDLGYTSIKSKTAAGVETTTSGIAIPAAQPLASSRLGFRGVEDLGGGLTAGFQIEANIHNNPGTTGSNSTTAFQFGRHQFVTLTSKTTGGVLIGKTDAGVKQIMDTYDAGFSNNMTGAYDGMGTSFTDITGSNVIGSRRDSTIRYTTPSFSGATLTAGWLKSTNQVTNAAGATTTETEDATGYEIGARYAQGAISAGISYRNAKSQSMAVAAVANTSTTVGGTTGSAAVSAINLTTGSLAAGASYNFGPAIAFIQYFNQGIKNDIASNEEKESAMAGGVRVPVTKAATLFASYTTGSKTNTSSVESKFNGFQTGALYSLSKRSDLYALYGQSKLTQDSGNDATASGMAIGIRHTF